MQIIKKFRKVTHSSAVDGLMTIITNSPSRDVTTQNEIVSSIIDLYFVRKLDDRIIKSTRGCSSSPAPHSRKWRSVRRPRSPPDEVVELRDSTMQSVIERNLGVLHLVP